MVEVVTEAAVLLEHAAVRFGSTTVLADLDVTVPAGQRVAVIGPSGAGKTTLFRAIAAILKPHEGRILTLGQDTARLRGRRLRKLRADVGLIYQNDNLIPQLRVVHNVLMGRLGHWSLPRALLSLLWPQELERARTALRQVELEPRLWAMPGELSGGQQQRVAIARLMLQQPRLMLADEPVSQLDIRLGRDVIDLLANLAAAQGATLMVNLHSLELLDTHFQRVIALRDGRLLWDGPVGDLDRRLLQEIYGAEYRALKLDAIADRVAAGAAAEQS
ncbi:MAG: ATP-binding cassette domain-containing protein [Gammaproteobacteria bacterium]|nr:ATP-binding cassette domain-containing protein [Gammaproteobacteria bacterium]